MSSVGSKQLAFVDMSGRARTTILGVTAVSLVGFVALAILDSQNATLRDGFVTQTMVWYGVAFAGFLAAVWVNERTPIPLKWIWGAAVVFRLLLLSTSPTLSDDVYRYIWEGNLLTEGISPYQAPINAAELDAFDIPARALVNNPTFASPYLPVTHVVFALTAAVLPESPLSFQLVMTLLELGAAWGLLTLLRLVRIPDRRILLWLWNPLVVIEIAHGAHLDAIMISLTIASLVTTFHPRFAEGSRTGLASPVLLGLATLTRPIPVLLTPVLFWRWSWVQRIAYAATLVVGVAPFVLWSGFGFGDGPGSGVFGSSQEYTETFRFNSAIYQGFEQWVGSQGLDDRGLNEPRLLTQLIIFGVFLSLMSWIWFSARQRTIAANDKGVSAALPLLRLAAAPIGVYVLLTPVFHPWYVLLLLALLVFHSPSDGEQGRRWVALVPWAWLSATLVISYITYEDPTFFFERAWVRRVEWWPTLLAGFVVFAFQRALFTSSIQEQPSAQQYCEPNQTAGDHR